MKPIVILFFGLLLAIGCGRSEEKARAAEEKRPALLTEEEAMAVYRLYINKEYGRYAAQMQSCDDKPASYKQQMATLYKQHAADQKGDDGDVVDARVARIVPQVEGKAAEAFLNLTYENGKTEEILLQFVHDGTAWRLR